MSKYVVRLPRLPVNWESPPELFPRYWDQAMTELEKSLNSLLQIPELQAAIEEAHKAADNANSAAGAAQSAADGTAKETSIVNSYVSGFASPLLSVTAAGVVTIRPHSRVYGDSSLNPTVSVLGGTLNTGAPPGSVVRIFYDDASRSGGSVTYQFTVDPASPPVQSGDRHSVGVVTVPDVGTDEGNYIKPPGYVNKNPNIEE